MPILDSLFVKLGYEYSEEQLEKFNELAAGTGRILKGVSLGAIGLASSFSLLFAKISSGRLQQSRIAESIGITEKSFESLKRTGAELVGNEGILTQLAEKLEALKQGEIIGQRDIGFAQGLDILGQDIDKFFKDLNPEEQIIKLNRLILDSSRDKAEQALSFIAGGDPLLRRVLSTKGLEGIIKGNRPADLDLKAVEKFDKAFRDMSQMFQDLTIKFGAPLLEKLMPLLKTFGDNLPDIASTLSVIAGNTGTVFDKVGKFLGTNAAKAKILYDEAADAGRAPDAKDFFDFGKALYNFQRFVSGKGPAGVITKQEITNHNKIYIQTDSPDVMQERLERIYSDSLRPAQENLNRNGKL